MSAHLPGDPDIDVESEQRILCHCGAVLADRIVGKAVWIDGFEYQYRRRSDLLTCPRCGTQHTMRDLSETPPTDVPDTELRRRHDDPPS